MFVWAEQIVGGSRVWLVLEQVRLRQLLTFLPRPLD